MPFRRPVNTALVLMLATAAFSSLGTAQEEAQAPLYVEVNCMKSASVDYAELERAIWQPMHQEMVNQGKKNSWSLYWVMYGDRSECDYYTVETYRGLGQLNDDRAFEEYFETLHPGESWAEAVARTSASRVMVRSELWERMDGVPPSDHRFVVVSQMYAEDGPDYVEFEQETWKPVHQALVDGGHSAGWSLHRLDSPHGISIPYNFTTMDFLKRLGSLPFEETMRSVHPDRETAAISQEGLELRDHLLAETWLLMASTE